MKQSNYCMNIDIKSEELRENIYNHAKLVCERDMGIIFPDKPDKTIEEWAEMVVDGIVKDIRSNLPFEA